MTTAAPAPPESTESLIAMIAWTIAHPKSHAFKKHVVEGQEFNDENFPPVVETAGQLKGYMMDTLLKGKTSIVYVDSTYYIYNRSTKAVIIINPAHEADGGTVFRNERPGMSSSNNYQDWHERLVKKSAQFSGINIRNIRKHECSLLTFLKSHPEAESALRREMTPIYRKKHQMDVIERARGDMAKVATAARNPVPQRTGAPVLSR
jgi:hypothetical protein